ncbi:MAG: UbiA family prenyltransferase [Candidatus Aminicenantes bacterium]|nr:MAG: UbiA family prenyltransferase [Candidatus Aminicenantes bacterium]
MPIKAESPASVWRQAHAQSLRGRRGLIKTIHMWFAVAVLVFLEGVDDAWHVIAACLQLLIAAACYVQVSILINDLADRGGDREAGKMRWIRSLRLGVARAVICAIALLGGLALVPGMEKAWPLAVYGGALAAGFLYSIKPIRLKEHGIWGLLAYALSTALAYALLPWVKLNGQWLPLVAVGAAVFFDKWVNLHFHQVIDFEDDQRSGTLTFAVTAGISMARGSLRWMARLASFSMAGVLVFLAMRQPVWGGFAAGLSAAALLAAGITLRKARSRQKVPSLLVKELPLHYLGLSWTVIRLVPLVLLAGLALDEPVMLLVFLPLLLLVLLDSRFLIRYRYK